MLTIPAMAQDVTIANNFRVSWYDCSYGLTQSSCKVDVQNLLTAPASGRDFNLSVFINSTNYDLSTYITALTMKERKILPVQVPIYENLTKNETLNINLSQEDMDLWSLTIANNSNIILINISSYSNATGVWYNLWYNISYNISVQNGTVLRNLTDWKVTKSNMLLKNNTQKMYYGTINIPKYNSKAKLDDLGITETINGTKTFLVEWSTPITKVGDGWGSSGLIGAIDESSGAIYHPWWNSLYYKIPLLINNTGNATTLTYHQVFFNITYNSNYMDANFTSFHAVNETSLTEIPFWIDWNNSINGSYVNITVNVTKIPASAWDNASFALYHRNVTEISASNGTNTFLKFDDFEGAGLLLWTDNAGTWVNSGGYRKQTSTVLGDLKNTYINISETDYIVHAKFKAISSLGTNTREGLTTEKDATTGNSWMEGTLDYINSSQSAILIPGVGWFGQTRMGFTAVADTWYIVDMLRQPNIQKISIQQIGNRISWQTQTTQTSRLNKIAGLMGGYETEVWYDDFYVRKYASPEPTGQVGTTQAPLNITSWGNTKTNNQSLNFTINTSESVTFNATANQMVTWLWAVNSTNQNVNYDNYTISWTTVGLRNVSVNGTNANGTSNTIYWNVTVQDITPPASITGLTNTTGNFYHNWTWINPTDTDFNYTMIYLNGAFIQNQSTNFYNLTANAHNITTISTHTVDILGNVNSTWVNQTSAIPNNLITINNISASYTIYAGQSITIYPNSTDADSDTPTFSTNATKGTFYSSNGTLIFNSVIGDVGVYNWNITGNDNYGSTSIKNFTVTVLDDTPSAPTGLSNVTGNFWINWTYSAGSNTDTIEVYINNSLVQNSSVQFYNGTYSAHATKIISLRGFNSTGMVYSGWTNQTTTIPNNAPTLASIGNKNTDEGTWLNFTLIGSDIDGDSLTYATNASKGTLTGADFNWSIPYDASGTYYWNFNVTDNYSAAANETITVTVNNTSPIPVSACGTLDIDGETYNLIQNISSVETGCLIVNANNITFDGQGYIINSDNGVVIDLELFSVSNNTITNFTATSDIGDALTIYLSSNNTISNFTAHSNTGYGIYMESTLYNIFKNGSITSDSQKEYVLADIGITNIFINTNFSEPRTISLQDSTSRFNYNDEYNGNIWLKTNISVPSFITRTLLNWTQSNMTWNDSATVTAYYELTGLLPDTSYNITNNSYPIYDLTTNNDGNLSIFSINLTGDTIITVKEYVAPPIYPPNITVYWNSINGWNQTSASLNVNNNANFNVTVNQTAINVSWKIGGVEQQNTSSLSFSKLFDTVGSYNVTAQAFNENGSSREIYTVVDVVSGGGGGTDWDYAYGWVKYPNGTGVNSATITTSAGSQTTNSNGYYSYGYVFLHGSSYWFNVSKTGYNNSNQSVSFAVGDYQIVNATIDLIVSNPAPNITSWSNSNTSNGTLTLTLPRYYNLTLNATSNQTITGCSWIGATQINCTGSDTYAFKNFTSTGVQTVSITVNNSNGTSNTITWTITVQAVGGLTVTMNVKNVLDLNLQNARIDFNGEYAFTDSNGNAVFSNIAEGNYDILARAIGYRNSTNTTTISEDTVMNFTLNERKTAVQVPGFESILGIGILIVSGLYIHRRSMRTSR